MAAPAPGEYAIQRAIVMNRADAEVLEALRKTQADVSRMLLDLQFKPGVGAQVRTEQLRMIQRNVKVEMAKLWRKVGNTTEARRLEAAVKMIELNQITDRLKLVAAGVPGGADIARAIADAERDAAERAIDRMTSRVQGASHKPLAQQVYASETALNGTLDNLLNSGLARGLSAAEFAKEIRNFVNPNTPGGSRYAALRTARTEINNAAHAVAIDAVKDKPWVESMQWHLSGSHKRSDVCNSLAKGGPKNDGVYPKGAVPAKPHPQCFCYVVPVTVSDDEFLDSLIAGKYNTYLEKYKNLQPGQVVRSNYPGGAPGQLAPVKPVKATKVTKATKPPKPVAPTKVKPPAEIPAPVSSELKKHLNSGIKSESKLSTGQQGTVDLLELNDGTTAIRKTVKNKARGRAGKDALDAEDLASLYAKRVGVRAPETVRESKLVHYQEHLDGVHVKQSGLRDADLLLTDDGKRAGLFDFVIGNVDRNVDNYFVGRDGRIQLFDHGMAFNPRQYSVMDGPGFTRAIAGDFDKYKGDFMGPSRAYSKADVDYLRNSFKGLEDEFRRLGHQDWIDIVQRNLDTLDSFAQGTGSLFGAPTKAAKPPVKTTPPKAPPAPSPTTTASTTEKFADRALKADKNPSDIMRSLEKTFGLSPLEAQRIVVERLRVFRGSAPAPVKKAVSLPTPGPINNMKNPAHRRIIDEELGRQKALTPKAHQKLKSVNDFADLDRSLGHGDALGLYYPGQARIQLNPKIFDPEYKLAFRKEVDTNWATPCGHDHSAPQSIVAHEFGHHVDYVMSTHPSRARGIWNAITEDLGVDDVAGIHRSALDQIVKDNKAKITRRVSRYGSTNAPEMLAEIWQEYSTMGDKARPFIKKIGKLMQELAEEAP